MVQRKAHSGGKEDGFEAYKILGQKNEVDKLCIPMICKFFDHDITSILIIIYTLF